MLLTLFGFALALGNWAGLIAMLVLPAAAFAYRITVEEAALLSTLGEPYAGRLAPALPGLTNCCGEDDDRIAHRAFVQTLGTDAVWRDYFTIKSIRAA